MENLRISRNLFIIILAVVSAGVLLTAYFFIRTQLPVSLDYKHQGVEYGETWRIKFTQEIKITSAPRMIPEVKGTWFEERGLFGVFALSFEPLEQFDKGSHYTANFSISRVGKDDALELSSATFLTSPAPGIASFDIDFGKEFVIPRPEIKLVVNDSLKDETFTPVIIDRENIAFEEITNTGTTHIWKPKADLPQDLPLVLEIRNSAGDRVLERHFQTVPEPKIEKITATEPVMPGDIIHVEFNVPMPLDSSPLTFEMPGKGSWVSPSAYEFKIESVKGGQNYAIRLLSGSLSKDGGKVMLEDVHTLASPGAVAATITNKGGERGVTDPITVSFDQPVDHTSAQNLFFTSPKSTGEFSWKGNVMTYVPNKLGYQVNYSATIGRGVVAIYGLPSASSKSITFRTVPEAFKLDVPYFGQEYKNSCEAASLRMALAFFKIKTDDMTLVKKFGYDPKPKDLVNNEWDDPRVMFVGDVTGEKFEGYGVYGPPVARVANSYGRKATFTTTITPGMLGREVHAGHPVVLWGYTSITEPPYSWHIKGDGYVKAFKGEHARVVVGVYGKAESPIGFFVHDPINGKKFEYWEASSLMKQVNAVPGVTNQAVIVK